MSVCLFVCLSLCLSLFACLSVGLSLSVSLSLSVVLSVCLSLPVCVFLSFACLSLSVCLFSCPALFCLSAFLHVALLLLLLLFVCLFFPSSYVYSSFSPSYLFTIVLVKLLSFPKCDLGRCFDERKARAFQGLIMKQYGKCETWSSDVRKKLKCFMKNLPKKCIGKMVSTKTPTKSTHTLSDRIV